MLGFLGLGVMGTPMALNLVRAGHELLVWSRSPGKCRPLEAAGAVVASSPADVFRHAPVVMTMLANDAALDEVLLRGTASFGAMLAGRTLVQLGTTPPEYSLALERDVLAAGGRYVEGPVSGSRKPAEAGRLIGMLAGERTAVAAVEPLLAPLCAKTVDCGPVPHALRTKLAVNLFLVTMVAGLAEAVHFAEREGVDFRVVREVLDAGPMASDVSRMKLEKLARRDDAVQASIADVAMNSRLIAEAARRGGIHTPLLLAADELFTQTVRLGLGASDMIEVIEAFRRS